MTEISQELVERTVPTPPKFRSGHALLDVTTGRKALADHIRKHGPVGVLIYAVMNDPNASDDGVSLEFAVQVLKVEITS